jgi:outer membrane protein assembly factor BamB
MRVRVVDSNGDPVAGVAVCDGLDVVTTDDLGNAELAAETTPFVWVSRPSGFDAARWFHRRDVAARTPEVVFELRPTEQSLPFRFAQITDLHVSALRAPARMPVADGLAGFDEHGSLALRPLTTSADLVAVLEELAAAAGPHGPPRFFVATGDLTDHGTAADYRAFVEALASSPLPIHALPGNHDHVGHPHGPGGGEGSGRPGQGFEEHVGPRWWSLTHAGLRLVALDWFSHSLGLDRETQERWLAADLATAAPGTAVLFLTHDQMTTAFYDRVREVAPHVRTLGSLSGHWHTSRVVRHGAELHANTGTTTFGGFDWSPAQGRLVDWDGDELSIRTVALRAPEGLGRATFAAARGKPLRPDGAAFAVRLPGAVHLARPLVVAGTVVVAWSDDDRAQGGLVCHDIETGERLWEAALDAPIRAGATFVPDGGLVVAVSVCGGVVAVDARSGVVCWRAQVGERLRAWVHAPPVLLPGAVAVGEVREYAALETSDGSLRWSRDDLEIAKSMATMMQGVVQDGVLVAGFSFMGFHSFGLDPMTGATVWRLDGNRFHSPTSDIVADPQGSDVFVVRLGGRVERMAAATGELRWRAGIGAAFSIGRPLVEADALFVSSGLGTLHCFDARDGGPRWETRLPGDRLLVMGPYRREGLAVATGPTSAGGLLVQPTGDGFVHRVDPSSGALTSSTAIGAPITAGAAAVGRDVIVATADGTLLRIVG